MFLETAPQRLRINPCIGAIGSESVRGFHTIELLLFKDGQNRKVLAE